MYNYPSRTSAPCSAAPAAGPEPRGLCRDQNRSFPPRIEEGIEPGSIVRKRRPRTEPFKYLGRGCWNLASGWRKVVEVDSDREGSLAALQGMDAVILLPTLNEEGGLPATLDDIPLSEIRAAGWSAVPLVLDGGSTDRTCEAAAARGIVVVPQRSRGKGAAIREGLELIRRHGVRFAVVLDADATYPGSAVLPALELLSSGSDLVVGVRQPDTGAPKSFRDLVHRVGNVLLNFAAGQYSRSTYLDLTSGFWAVDVQKARALRLSTDHFGIEAELFLKAHQHGWNASQIPVAYRKRVGSPKLHAVPDGMRILLTIIRFGRRSLQAAPPTISETPTIMRDLLLTSFIQDHQDVVLLCPPQLHGEALSLAERLRRTGLSPRIEVQEALPSPPPFPGHPTPSTPTPIQPRAGGRSDGVSLRFAARDRLLRVELAESRPSGAAIPGIAELVPDTSRSGAYLGRVPRGQADFFDPLRLMGGRLNSDPGARRRSLLSANGLHVDEVREYEIESTTGGRIVFKPRSG